MSDNDFNPLWDVAAESADLMVDTLCDNELIKNIPLIGWAVKTYNGVWDLRSAIFRRKLHLFVHEVDKTNGKINAKWLAKATVSPEECHRIGESLLIILEQTNDLRRAEIFGVLFIAFANDQLDAADFLRLIQAVDLCFPDDVLRLVALEDPETTSRDTWLRHLQRGGFSTRTSATAREVNQLYRLSIFGKQLRTAFRNGRQLQESNKT